MRGLLVFVSNTQEHGKTVEGRKIEQNLMSFHTDYIYTLLVIMKYSWRVGFMLLV